MARGSSKKYEYIGHLLVMDHDVHFLILTYDESALERSAKCLQ
jgi:hypothetical protein